MEIKGKVHCLFEQSGTFKKEFIKLGVPAEDYDIQDNFNETDHVTDLFQAIDDAYDDKPSIFDNITKDDLIVAFFPCIFFCQSSQLAMTYDCINYRCLDLKGKLDKILERSRNREYFYEKIIKMVGVCQLRGLRLIIENPCNGPHYLLFSQNFIAKPALIDKNRRLRGDYYEKPTAFWFINCEPTYGESFQKPKMVKSIMTSKSGIAAGICSEDRSLISPDYARNWICDFVLGKVQTDNPELYNTSLF